MKDFIWTKEGAVESSKCKQLIEMFERFEKSGLVRSRRESENTLATWKEDLSVGYNFATGFQFEDPAGMTIAQEIMDSFMEYSEEYQSLVNLPLAVKHFRYQKTKPGEGYHIWHYETMEESTARRVAVFTLYLNDIEEGGETEFLYQKRRVSPKEGTIVWWPAGYTHPHRGNPPLGEVTKYIVTGWVEFQ